MSHLTAVNVSIPHIDDLCCINCKINPMDMCDPIIKSLFHCQILTCRLIIYSVKCCIASPSFQNIENLVHVIISKRFYSTGKLQEHLKNLKIQFTEPEPVHPKIYEACLKYTFTFKLAPFWNLVGKSFYLRGSSCLSFPESNDAVEWNIFYNANGSKIELKPLKLSISPFNIIHSQILSPGIMNKFIADDSIDLLHVDIQNIWVYVLPKLTRAKVISVSKKLPKNCPFNNYNDLRRHWKNMYSYRLPKSDQEVFYYEVVFPKNPHQSFIYPELCLFSKTPQYLLCEKKNEIASEFINDVCTKVQSVCGEALKIGSLSNEPNYPCTFSVETDHMKKVQVLKNSSTISPGGKLNSELFTFKRIGPSDLSMKKSTQKSLLFPENFKLQSNSQLNHQKYLTQNFTSGSENLKTNLTKKNSLFTNPKLTQSFRKNENCVPFSLLSKNNCADNVDDEIVLNNAVNHRFTDELTKDDLDSVISYYDLPSMWAKTPEEFQNGTTKDAIIKDCENYKNFLEKNSLRKLLLNQTTLNDGTIENIQQHLNGSKKINSITPEVQKGSNQPAIKKVEKVQYNLNELKKGHLSTDKKLAEQYQKMLTDDMSVSNYDGQSLISTRFNSFPNYNENILKLQTQLPINDQNSSYDENNQLRSLLPEFDGVNIFKQDKLDINGGCTQNLFEKKEQLDDSNSLRKQEKPNDASQKELQDPSFSLENQKIHEVNGSIHKKLNFKSLNQSLPNTPCGSSKSESRETPEQWKARQLSMILKRNDFDRYKQYICESPFFKSLVEEQESLLGENSSFGSYLLTASPKKLLSQKGKNDLSHMKSNLSLSSISNFSNDSSLNRLFKQKNEYGHEYKIDQTIYSSKLSSENLLNSTIASSIKKYEKNELEVVEKFDVNKMYNELKQSLTDSKHYCKIDQKDDILNSHNLNENHSFSIASELTKITPDNFTDVSNVKLLEDETTNIEDTLKNSQELKNDLIVGHSSGENISYKSNHYIPSPINKNELEDPAENLANFPSPEIFDSFDEQNSLSLLDNKKNELENSNYVKQKEKSDFLSVLSESSNESNSNNDIIL